MRFAAAATSFLSPGPRDPRPTTLGLASYFARLLVIYAGAAVLGFVFFSAGAIVYAGMSKPPHTTAPAIEQPRRSVPQEVPGPDVPGNTPSSISQESPGPSPQVDPRTSLIERLRIEEHKSRMAAQQEEGREQQASAEINNQVAARKQEQERSAIVEFNSDVAQKLASERNDYYDLACEKLRYDGRMPERENRCLERYIDGGRIRNAVVVGSDSRPIGRVQEIVLFPVHNSVGLVVKTFPAANLPPEITVPSSLVRWQVSTRSDVKRVERSRRKNNRKALDVVIVVPRPELDQFANRDAKRSRGAFFSDFLKTFGTGVFGQVRSPASDP